LVEFEIKNYKGQIYLKEELKKILNTNPLRCIPNRKAVIIFPGNVNLEEIRRSVRLILMDIKEQIRTNNETDNNEK
jgi:hypothetical protein